MKHFTLSFLFAFIFSILLAASLLFTVSCGKTEEPTNTTTTVPTPTWVTKAPMQTARANFGLAVVGDKIYVIGGTEGNSMISTVEEYDPATDTWSYKQSLPMKRGNFCASVVNGKIYVAGGRKSWVGQDSLLARYVEEYDPSSNTWTIKTEMNPTRWVFGSCEINGEFYIISGCKTASLPLPYTGLVTAYNPSTDTWSTKTDIPTKRWFFTSCVWNNKIYSIGGFPETGSNGISTIEAYDPATDVWNTYTSLPTARLGLSAVFLNNKLYAMGGVEIMNGSSLAIVEQYSPN